jgi:hypothetical protein
MNNFYFVSVNQAQEVGLQQLQGYGHSLKYAYARAAETQEYNDVGQDYLQVVHESRVICFAVCDGVSQSYCGDVASKYLGSSLVEWLRAASETLLRDEWLLRKSFQRYLGDLTFGGKELVDGHELPVHVSGLMREVLLEKKNFGSESTYVCGRIDLPSDEQVQGRLTLLWQGDTRMRLWSGGREHTEVFGSAFNTADRWSTNRGSLGMGPHSYTGDLALKHSDTKLIVYTDGLKRLDNIHQLLQHQQIEQLMQESLASNTSDDIAYVELSFI